MLHGDFGTAIFKYLVLATFFSSAKYCRHSESCISFGDHCNIDADKGQKERSVRPKMFFFVSKQACEASHAKYKTLESEKCNIASCVV